MFKFLNVLCNVYFQSVANKFHRNDNGNRI
ncbi:hypothetical protein FHX64_000365 [Microbacter margulisiae]|uniref:Uncharacterized protein n=1 Tax=Microbacter margulisiae TaxID=1350067 RepID=A0A7W5DNR5_9PORP|nr:hypothetical protein [Microbacter margulisiae]